MWIDTNGCEERWHEIKRVDGQLFCVHSDGSECEDAEYNVREESEAA